jgi:uncharacterized protein (TIGR03083 family)
MQADAYVAAFEREGRLLASSATGHLDAPVAACPGWVVADVVGHLGRVYRSIAEILRDRLVDPPTSRIPKPPVGAAVIEFFDEGFDELVAALRATPPDTPVYTWSPDGVAGFYHRRVTHETGVHRFDVQTAVGQVDAFDSDLAADGVDELYGVVLPFGLARIDAPRPTGSLHLHRTDGPGEWTLELVDGSLCLSHGHTKGTAAVRGPASDLFVFAWNRGRSAALEVFGDEAVADAWAHLAP